MSVTGQQTPSSASNEYNAMVFVFQQLAQKMQTITLVKVVAVRNAGGVEPVGSVDVQPLIFQMTGDRQSVPHGTIFDVPYFRIQGGTDAVILDPKVGDIGLCAFASRDISSLKANPAQAASSNPAGVPPASFRMFDWADGLYLGGYLNGTPEQWVRFSASGIEVHSPTKITLSAPQIEIDGTTRVTVNTPDLELNGTTTAKITSPDIELAGPVTQTGGGAVTLSGDLAGNGAGGATFTHDVVAAGKSLDSHTHNVVNVQSGGSTIATTAPL